MNTPPLNLRIQRDREIFWSHALAKITDKSSLQRFVRSYLSFLGREYDTAILQAIAQLQHVPHKNQRHLRPASFLLLRSCNGSLLQLVGCRFGSNWLSWLTIRRPLLP